MEYDNGNSGPESKPAAASIHLEHEDEEIKRMPTADLDDAILRAQGHIAELERSFSLMGVVGLAFSITNSWLTYAASFGLVLVAGGGLTALVGLIIAAIAQWIVLIGLAELSSALPSSGGQYHYTYIVAPKSTRNFAAYMVGFWNIIAWWANAASGTIYVAISTFGIVQMWYPDVAGTQWQVYLCYLLCITITLIPIFTVPQRQLDKMTKSSMLLSILGLVLVVLVVLIMGRGNYQPGNLSTMSGVSGWSPGVGWMLGISTGEYCFFGTGACTHLAEELPRPARRLPRVINLTMIIGVTTSLVWIVVMLCGIQDLEAVQTAAVPNLEAMYQATGSKVAASFLQAYLTMLYYTCVPSQWITCSRIAWAFARDNGLPYSDYFKVVSKKYQIPVRTTLLSASFCAIYGLLWIASTQAFNSLVNTAILLLNLTFTVPQGIILTRGRSVLPRRPFDLGRFGYAVNCFSVLWMAVSGTFLCFPNTLPVEKTTMNYNSVVIVGLLVIVLACWTERRKKFNGPEIDWVALNANAALE